MLPDGSLDAGPRLPPPDGLPMDVEYREGRDELMPITFLDKHGKKMRVGFVGHDGYWHELPAWMIDILTPEPGNEHECDRDYLPSSPREEA